MKEYKVPVVMADIYLAILTLNGLSSSDMIDFALCLFALSEWMNGYINWRDGDGRLGELLIALTV